MDLKVEGRRCSGCSSEVQYSNRYDSYFCELCNQWLEQSCTDPNCEFCSSRPKKPSQCLEN